VKQLTLSPIRTFSKTLRVPGDKSISHRAVMLGAIAKGKTEIRNFLSAEDCLQTLKVFKRMGIPIKRLPKNRVLIEGKGLRGLKPPKGSIDLGNSGTSMRLLSGLLSGQPFQTRLTGDASLSQRPMNRVILPLEKMGSTIRSRRGFPPLWVQGGTLHPIRYRIPIPSAQVKSAILLAALYATGRTVVREVSQTRDHTERMLRQFGIPVTKKGRLLSLEGGHELRGARVDVPGDISSAAFLIVLAAALQGAKLTLKDVGLNPTRTGFIRILKKMKAQIQLLPKKRGFGEPVGEIRVRGSRLRGVQVRAEEIPDLIDELPILMVAASVAEGRSIFRKASELRVKETDRIHSMVTNLKKMGVAIREVKDDVIIDGGNPLYGNKLESFKDHRTAMSLAVAARLAQTGKTVIRDISCIQTSFPGFVKLI